MSKHRKWGEDLEVGRGGANFNPAKGRYSSGSTWVSKLGLDYKAGGVLKRKDQPGKASGRTGTAPKDPTNN